jgi:hypothetical protein
MTSLEENRPERYNSLYSLIDDRIRNEGKIKKLMDICSVEYVEDVISVAFVGDTTPCIGNECA